MPKKIEAMAGTLRAIERGFIQQEIQTLPTVQQAVESQKKRSSSE